MEMKLYNPELSTKITESGRKLLREAIVNQFAMEFEVPKETILEYFKEYDQITLPYSNDVYNEIKNGVKLLDRKLKIKKILKNV
jgi:hypothetical protein